jgi:hypothetical protein
LRARRRSAASVANAISARPSSAGSGQITPIFSVWAMSRSLVARRAEPPERRRIEPVRPIDQPRRDPYLASIDLKSGTVHASKLTE